ncbi:hypothetical protein Pint_06388 [Pistacia integerrima]|uniref:Uncharacterized protein n=1 Tax=Pistacia integerrima TaxID=434235 RepID=A0ACC0Z7R5_9ROSI|nr:hypothetical protein Pint_06388 [Pistacia integerrima]
MGSQITLSWVVLLNLTLLISCTNGSSSDDRKEYIVYMGDRPDGEFSASLFHASVLQELLGSGAEEHLLHSYHRSFNGFLASKIIGAKYYRAEWNIWGKEDFKSPRDSEGHGTHTSSTAAGGLVSKASLFGLGLGTARGGGVNLLRIILKTPISIGSFHAMKNGILTSTSAGNTGPRPATAVNVSPWSLSVAGSTIDRKFVAKVKLGNGHVYEVRAIAHLLIFQGKMFPLIYGGDAPDRETIVSEISYAKICLEDSLNETLVRGKMVLCDELGTGNGPAKAGAAGCIMQGTVEKYLNSTRKPTATIFKSIMVKDELAPPIATFSGRGPNPITLDILKPDLTAPGVDILAAWTQASTTSEYNRVSPYNIISGASMACPHVTAVAAYIKSFHPTWSPAAIKSALMTTASPMSVEDNRDAEFAYGSGHLNPLKATEPDKTSCSKQNNGTVWDLNYPSFAVSTKFRQSTSRVFHRTVTNVGSANSTYKAIVKTQPGLSVQVQPCILSFKSLGEKKFFVLTVTATMAKSVDMTSGSLVWDDGVHQVRSPVVAYVLSN